MGLTSGGMTSVGGAATEHTDQDVTAKSLTLTQAAASNAIDVPTNARVKLGGHASAYLYGDGTNATIFTPATLAASGNLFSGSSGNVQVGSSGLRAQGNNALSCWGNATDGVSAVGVKLGNINSLATAGAKIASFFIDTGSNEKASISKDGKLSVDATDSSGTAGNVTINKPAGLVAIANGASTVTVTNSCVSATSIVIAVLQETDGSLYIKSVVPASGSFVINLSGNATADRTVGFIVFN